MSILFSPYLNFAGNTKEAMEFYKSIFGGELTLSTFGEQPGMDVPPGYEEKIMHADLNAPDIRLFASESMPGPEGHISSGFSLSLSGEGEDEAKLKEYFDKLQEGGKVTMPLEKAPWGDWFGMVDDKFGIHWMVNIATPGE
jgi:PhnB protein